MRSPIKIVGGKYRLAQKIISLIPPHEVYVEPFGGAGHVLFKKPPSHVEIYNDINSDLVNLFRVIKDTEKFKEFYKQVFFTLYSKEEFKYYKNLVPQNDIEQAVKTFVLVNQSFNNKQRYWGISIRAIPHSETYFAIIKSLHEIRERLKKVYIENSDFRKIIKKYDCKDTFFFIDPPYMLETRKCKMYPYEMTLDDHKDLVNLLLEIKGQAILSCYYHEVYAPLVEKGWQRQDYEVVCQAVGKIGKYKGENALKNHFKRVETLLIKVNKGRQLTLLSGT
jgi:DNA adenine methylase